MSQKQEHRGDNEVNTRAELASNKKRDQKKCSHDMGIAYWPITQVEAKAKLLHERKQRDEKSEDAIPNVARRRKSTTISNVNYSTSNLHGRKRTGERRCSLPEATHWSTTSRQKQKPG